MSEKQKQSNSQLFHYNEEVCESNYYLSEDDIMSIPLDHDKFYWLNFHSFELKEQIQNSYKRFDIHRVTQNDIAQLKERPKIEEFEDYIFVTLKSIFRKKGKAQVEQMSFVLKDNALISYQERHGDLFNEIRGRLKNNTGIVRTKKVDYLLYLLIDAVLKSYQNELSDIQKRIDDTQVVIHRDFNESFFNQVEKYKDELKLLKKSLSPLRDQLVKLSNSRNRFIEESNIPYYNDLKDQILYIFDEIDEEKSDLESMTNQYFAVLSQRSNEVMQFLTIVAALFIPLTFIVGVYGMNFQNMPELQSEYGYYVVWAVMLLITIGLILYFRKKKWF
ncbi:magnesium/cobalt transporter CorA [Parvicella tangerina]|uniref:Magnesium transport protein CorA n=1 Tax=Parvicella tangerina TaxID=2829795 RepID=A0A916JMZ2_9FLAO|nr:magnesium/cobalt transporter CorA [Parvicella tangerina]CAG5081784.1 Cobalt/magnesium transport protein CorA [Parvicella tangerina]